MKISKILQAKIDRAVKEKVDIVPYDPRWKDAFTKEATFLKNRFPETIRRIEHFGSTAVFGLSAKPIVDMLVEIRSHKEVKQTVVPVLESLGYDYFWRPTLDKPPYYAWFIKRDKRGNRTHHIHMVRRDSPLWDRLYFRDYLISRPDIASQYEQLKKDLAKKYANDREAYTKAKTDFIVSITERAKKHNAR